MRKPIDPLGTTEMEVLQIVWELGEATVGQVHECILRQRKTAYTTIMTTMKNLARKEYLQYRTEGITYIYSAIRTPEEVRGGMLENLLDKVFKGSSVALVQTLVGHERLSESEKAEIRAMIAAIDEDPD
ncbi:MAG TPA: BlaI/MecI/CopY family transcriptional regulator [Rhodothermales bacterium]|nr:BlaI/MecI/CopY family transcriptional regulator [Rhodothermales bacterium]HRR07519.1 BlaI/MecI/CopY family transcriptional regulator [Rhodothermales bacterium]